MGRTKAWLLSRRRSGEETYERLVQPLVGGIYTADPEKLSLRATLPRFAEMERLHGSLIRAARADRGTGKNDGLDLPDDAGARYSMFVAPREGSFGFCGGDCGAAAGGLRETKYGGGGDRAGWRQVAGEDERLVRVRPSPCPLLEGERSYYSTR